MTDHNTFQVDLRGVVDLLSQHLYGSPRVYVRELLQNAVDATTARGSESPGTVMFESSDATGDGTLRVHDAGIGLTESQVHELLATIGRSSKRDDFGFARHEFLGQFGIGMLSCFVVADEIHVLTRAADSPTVEWTGYADGRYQVTMPNEQRTDIGTTVTLRPRRGTEHWLTAKTVFELARLYGSMLPLTVSVDGVPTTETTPPWLAADRVAALTAYARDTFDLDPLDVIELNVPEAGLVGAAFVLATPSNPVSRAGHRVYLKRMLLAENVDGLLPDWAFFARCVVDTTELRPTASREALFEDGLLDSVREALGDQLRGWLVRMSTISPQRLLKFLSIHQLGVKALALHDDEMLKIVERWLPFETNVGSWTLADFRDRYGVLRYSATSDQFRQLAAVAAVQDIPLINASHTAEVALIERLALVDSSIKVERLDPSDLSTRFEVLEPAVDMSLRPFKAAAQRAMDALGCELVVRSFDPAGLSAIYLADREAEFRSELRATKDKSDDIWAGVLGALDDAVRDTRPQLVLNYRNPLVRRVTVLPTTELIGLAIEALYGQALLTGYHPIRPADVAAMNRSFLGLLDRAVPSNGEVTP